MTTKGALISDFNLCGHRDGSFGDNEANCNVATPTSLQNACRAASSAAATHTTTSQNC